MAEKQPLLIDDGSDLPLFSRTAARAEVQAFTPPPADRQLGMFECNLCRDTGLVKAGSRWIHCVCRRSRKHLEPRSGERGKSHECGDVDAGASGSDRSG